MIILIGQNSIYEMIDELKQYVIVSNYWDQLVPQSSLLILWDSNY